ncbi:MAG: glycoside hydrolase family 2 TIM barrel-domain containing protein [Terracidiphilus sp.]
MPLSRRDFLEAGAISASGVLLTGLASRVNGIGEAPEPGNQVLARDLIGLPEARIVLGMNQDWQFFRPRASSISVAGDSGLPPNDADWKPAALPHTVRLEPRDVSGGRNYQGVCWYRRPFAARTEWRGRIVYLKFQGAMQVADVWLNQVHLITHYGGYLPFTIDISRAIRFNKENLLVVRLDNSDNPQVPPGKPQSELDFCYFGGLYRSVHLEILEPLHITDPILADRVGAGGILVTYPAVAEDESTIQVQTEVANESDVRRECTLAQVLMGPEGNVAGTATQTLSMEARAVHAITQKIQVRNVKLWRPENPQLYWLHTSVSAAGRVTDDQKTRIGIRSIQFDRDRGLLINGRPFFSLGANRHQDHPYVGCALPPSAHYRDAYKLREAGFTSFRSHYPQDPSFMDACDELGILAIVSNPGWQFVGDDVFKRRAYQDAREMIRRDRNRPSVVIWEAALNESDNSSVAADLYRIVHQELPCPECYTAGDPIRRKVEGFNGWDIEYVGNPHTKPGRPSWVREWGDQVDNWTDQQGRVRVSRSWGEGPMLVQASAHMLSMDRICLSEFKPAGADLWAGIDAFRGYHHQPFQGAPLDLFRLPKFDYYMFQSQRPPFANAKRPGSGPMVFIANFATFYSPLSVIVFSNCEQVRLTQNGTLIATQEPDAGYRIPHPPFTFKVGEFSNTRSMLFGNPTTQSGIVQPVGQLLAEGLIGGKVMASHTVQSPGVPTEIIVRLDACGVDPVADGADWVRVYAHICDARGTTHPFSDDLVTFTVEGEGSIIGDETIYANPVRAEAGIATALVRTSRVPGTIVVHAVSPGLKGGTAQFESRIDPSPALG